MEGLRCLDPSEAFTEVVGGKTWGEYGNFVWIANMTLFEDAEEKEKCSDKI